MDILCTRQEALNNIRATLSAETIATFFETLFAKSILFALRAPLLRNAITLFDEHWSRAKGEKLWYTPKMLSNSLEELLLSDKPKSSGMKRLLPMLLSYRLS